MNHFKMTLSFLSIGHFWFLFAGSHAFRALGPTVTLKGGVEMPSVGLGSAVSYGSGLLWLPAHVRNSQTSCNDSTQLLLGWMSPRSRRY